MRLNSLQMKNFKKYKGQVKIEFQDGLTGIVGKNGSGKSTIVEAVAWALYGSKASSIKRDFLKNSHASEKEELEVRLSLNLDDKEVLIQRSMRGKSLSSDAKLFIDKRMVSSGVKEVEFHLEEILNIGFQDFMKTFYARQKDLDNLLKEGGSKKKEYLLTLLGLDEIRDRALDRIRADVRKLEGEVGRMEGALTEIGDVKGEITDLKGRFYQVKVELAKAEATEANSVSDLEKRRQDLEEMAGRKRAHERLVEGIGKLESSQEEKKAAIEEGERRLDLIDQGRWQLFELEPKLARSKEVKVLLEDAEPKRAEHESLLQKSTRIEAEMEGKVQAFEDLKGRLEMLKTEGLELESIHPQEEEYQRLVIELKGLDKTRDVYVNMLSEAERECAKLEALESNISRTKTALEKLSKSRSRLEEIEPLKERYESLLEERSRLDRERELQKQFSDLAARLESIRMRKGRLIESRLELDAQVSGLGDLENEETELKLRDDELDLIESNLNEKLAQMRLREGLLKSKRNEAKGHLAGVKGLGEESNCPTCERPLGGQYRILVEKYRDAVSNADGDIKILKEEIQEMGDRLEKASITRSKLKRSFDELLKKKSQKGELLAEIRSLEVRISEQDQDAQKIEEEISTLGPVRYDPERHEDVESTLKDFEPLIQEHAELRIKLEDLPKKTERLAEEQLAQKTLSGRIENLRLRVDQLGYDEKSHAEKRKRFSILAPIHERFSSLESRLKDAPQLEVEIQNRERKLDQIRDEGEKLLEEKARLGFDPEEYERLQEERKTFRGVEETANKIKLSLAAEGEIRRHLDEAKRIASSLEAELEGVRDQLSHLDYNEEGYLKTERALEKAKSKVDEVRKSVSKLQVQAGVLEGEAERLQKEKWRKEELEKKVNDARKQLQVVETTRNLTNRFMDHILVRIRNEIAVNAGQILREVAGKYGRVSIDQGFNILVEDEGEFYPISRYSGGEVDMIAVSVRVAISEYLMRFGQNGPGCSFLILDEVFGSQDVEHRESMISMLRSLDDRFPQIFAISHIGEVQGQFDNAIQVIEEEDGSSRVEVEL